MSYTKEEQEESYKHISQVKVYTLVQIMKIINTACTRGAFQANEMIFVGNIYDSLSNVVNKSLEKAKEDLKVSEVGNGVGNGVVNETNNQELAPIPEEKKKKKKSKQPIEQSLDE